MLYEWPHPQIDHDWDLGAHQWREITPLAYQELQQIPLLHTSSNAFMQSEPVDILPDGDGLYVYWGAASVAVTKCNKHRAAPKIPKIGGDFISLAYVFRDHFFIA